MQPWRLKPSSANHLSHNGHATLKAMRQCATQIVPESSETQFKRLCWCWSASCTALADSQTRSRFASQWAKQAPRAGEVPGKAETQKRKQRKQASQCCQCQEADDPSDPSSRSPTCF